MATPAENIPSAPPQPPKILWSCVARNDVILAETGEECYGGLVSETARGLLARKATPGYEFHQQRKWPKASFRSRSTTTTGIHQPRLRGCKFHLFEHDEENVQDLTVWIFAAVYDASCVDQAQVQSFLEKIVALTEIFRDDAPDWRTGDSLACQATFAPILQQRMQEVTYLGKMAMLEERLESSRKMMSENVDLLLDRDELLRNQLSEKSSTLQDMASVFKERTRKVRRMKMMQNAKHGLILGTAVTAGVAIIVIPPLIALL
jgi:hypothetical protein